MNLLLAAALLLQDKTAGETFKKIEETITSARTVSVHFTFQDPVRQLKGSGTYLLKEHKKMNLTYKYQALVGVQLLGGVTTVLSDGQRTLKTEASGAQQIFGAVQDTQVPITRTGFPRLMAAFYAVDVDEEQPLIKPLHPPSPDQKPLNFAKMAELKGFIGGADDNDEKTLTYFLKEKGHSEPLTIRLWYDPKSLAIRKRTVTGKLGSAGNLPETTLTEIYDDFTLNADIPDEKFKLPEEKK
jgi:outer membrane lipoprotein-sorting protein